MLPFGRRNQNLKTQTRAGSHTFEVSNSVTFWFISSGYQKQSEVYSADSAPLCSGDCTLLGGKQGMKWRCFGDNEREWGEGEHYLVPHLVNSRVQVSFPKWAEVQSPSGATAQLSIVNLPLPTSWFNLFPIACRKSLYLWEMSLWVSFPSLSPGTILCHGWGRRYSSCSEKQ